jgi:glycerophosphoryl diester phosphodiesterase
MLLKFVVQTFVSSYIVFLLASTRLIDAQVTSPHSLITGHRGASSVAPENTLAAFHKAWEVGCDAIEGDFRLTADKKIVCIHDSNTQRTTGIDKDVSKTSLQSLQTLDFGTWKDVRYAGETCPTLGQVLLTVPSHGQLFVELKTGPEIVEPLAECLQKSSLPMSQITLITFNENTAKKCRMTFPNIRIHWLTYFQRHKTQADRWSPSAEQIASTIEQVGADGVGLQARRDVVTQSFLSQLRNEGVTEFHVWTVDDPDDANFFIREGAFAVTTNTPAQLRQHMKAH